MPNEIYSIEQKSESLVVKTVLRLISVTIQANNFNASFLSTRLLPDGTQLAENTLSVDRNISDLDDDFSKWYSQIQGFTEGWRQEDAQARADAQAASDAEAARWAALSDDDKATEVANARAQRQAATDAALAAIDPAASIGLVSSVSPSGAQAQVTP